MYKLYISILVLIFINCRLDINQQIMVPNTLIYKDSMNFKTYLNLELNHIYQNVKKNNLSFLDPYFDENQIDKNDSNNFKSILNLYILHQYLSTNNASNGSTGKYVKIPYYWHWVNPNPRYEIVLTTNNKKLNTINPPKEYNKYKSYADIDRTPSIFIKDLISDVPKYYESEMDSFYTFGWCSEREMSYLAILNALNYNGEIVVSGNHCWTEVILKLKNNKNTDIYIKIKIDNTFDDFEFENSNQSNYKQLELKNSKKENLNWYHKKALEKMYLSECNIKAKAMQRMHLELMSFID